MKKKKDKEIKHHNVEQEGHVSLSHTRFQFKSINTYQYI